MIKLCPVSCIIRGGISQGDRESAKQDVKVASRPLPHVLRSCCLLSLSAFLVRPIYPMAVFSVHRCKLGAFLCHGMLQVWLL